MCQDNHSRSKRILILSSRQEWYWPLRLDFHMLISDNIWSWRFLCVFFHINSVTGITDRCQMEIQASLVQTLLFDEWNYMSEKKYSQIQFQEGLEGRGLIIYPFILSKLLFFNLPKHVIMSLLIVYLLIKFLL